MESSEEVTDISEALSAVVTDATPSATKLLQSSSLIAALAERIAGILHRLLAEGAPFSTISLDVSADQEAAAWQELVFCVVVRGDFTEMMHWWRKFSGERAALNEYLPEHERAVLARDVGMHFALEDSGQGV